MTTYQVISDEDEHHLMASWPDLPSPATHHVTTFQERKFAKATSNVLNAAARYRWHRALQLLQSGIFTEAAVGPDPTVIEPPPGRAPAIADLAVREPCESSTVQLGTEAPTFAHVAAPGQLSASWYDSSGCVGTSSDQQTKVGLSVESGFVVANRPRVACYLM